MPAFTELLVFLRDFEGFGYPHFQTPSSHVGPVTASQRPTVSMSPAAVNSPPSITRIDKRFTSMSGAAQGAIVGAGVTLGITLASKILQRLFRHKKTLIVKMKVPESDDGSTVSTPKHKIRQVSDADLKAFGSPTMIDLNRDVASLPDEVPQVSIQPAEGSAKAEVKRPTGQLKQQLQLIQDAKEENARLRGFMQQYMATSEKMKTLEQENADLKNITSRLESQLNYMKSKSVVSNGDELKKFKDSITFPVMARSVCSDVEFGMKDNGSVDGTASVFDIGQRKKIGSLTQLFAWASSNRANALAPIPSTPTPSQPSTPRRASRATQEDAMSNSDVVKMLEAFSGSGMTF